MLPVECTEAAPVKKRRQHRTRGLRSARLPRQRYAVLLATKKKLPGHAGCPGSVRLGRASREGGDRNCRDRRSHLPSTRPVPCRRYEVRSDRAVRAAPRRARSQREPWIRGARGPYPGASRDGRGHRTPPAFEDCRDRRGTRSAILATGAGPGTTHRGARSRGRPSRPEPAPRNAAERIANSGSGSQHDQGAPPVELLAFLRRKERSGGHRRRERGADRTEHPDDEVKHAKVSPLLSWAAAVPGRHEQPLTRGNRRLAAGSVSLGLKLCQLSFFLLLPGCLGLALAGRPSEALKSSIGSGR